MSKLMIFIAVYAAFCVAKCFSKIGATESEIMQLTEQLFKEADLSFYPKIKIQSNGNPLLSIDENALRRSQTVQRMRDLFDDYEMDINVAEKDTEDKRKEQNAFIDALLNTKVIKTLMNFLVKKQAVANRRSEQIYLLKALWFRVYSRVGKVLGSSGFEHIFLHETGRGDILGLHNWIYFHDLQKKNNKLVFKRLKKQLNLDNKVNIMKFSFSYDNIDKPSGSIFVGTPPELDVALYTLCVVMDMEKCPISMAGQKFIIRAYSFKHGPNVKMIASGYPDF